MVHAWCVGNCVCVCVCFSMCVLGGKHTLSVLHPTMLLVCHEYRLAPCDVYVYNYVTTCASPLIKFHGFC